MKWSIVTDSSCDYPAGPSLGADIHFARVPFIIRIGERDYLDDETIRVPDMLNDMESCAEAGSTACPSPGAWQELFEQADQTIAITISAGVSGSYDSAEAARRMVLEKHPDKKIWVLNSRSAGSALSLYVEKAVQLIEQGLDFDGVVAGLEAYAAERHTVFALASFTNLIKNGRVGRLSGFIAGKLGIWGIGIASEEGTIVVKTKTRGIPRVIDCLLGDMKEHHFQGGEVIISHCQNLELAVMVRERILELWDNARVQILATGGLCSFYAERRGLILAY